jgi:hypothetical protein
MTTNEIIKEIAVYDGHTFTTDILGTTVKKEGEINRVALDGTNLTKYPYFHSYLTELNILHRVAVKAVSEIVEILDNIENKNYYLATVKNTVCTAMFDLPINGEYITLATATAEAIIYLKSHKP